MFKRFVPFLLTTSILISPCMAQDASNSTQKNDAILKKEPPREDTITSAHTMQIGSSNISYQTTVGTQLLNDEQGNPKASIFYVAYTKENPGELRDRPITFCFNGGPGSSSVWLHLGVLGPKRVDMDEQGKSAIHPFHLVDNQYSILDITDLVFIDPVSTGFSRAIPQEEAKNFHGVEKDIQSVAEFIRLYTTRNERWLSPKYLAGESYGTTRASGLALELHDKHHLYLDGIMLISSVLNFQTIRFTSGNDLPYILYLPSYTAAALYHNKLDPELQKDPKKTLAEAEHFAYNDYTTALMYGANLDNEKREEIINKLAKYTGISKDYIDRSDLRIHIFRFAKELLRNERRTVGRFDSRLKGIDSDLCDDVFAFDPSMENIIGAFTATFNNYIRSDLKWKRDEEYRIIADVQPWDYGVAYNQFLDVGENLREVMGKNNMLDVFVASGYSDLATPYFATEYTFSHLGLDPLLRENIVLETYEGGHMMYLNYPTLVKLKEDLRSFFNRRSEKKF